MKFNKFMKLLTKTPWDQKTKTEKTIRWLIAIIVISSVFIFIGYAMALVMLLFLP